MMEKTLILKHISRMLCLLISYSKFTRTLKIIDIDILSAFFYNESSKKEKEDFYGIRFTIRTLYCQHRNCVLE